MGKRGIEAVICELSDLAKEESLSVFKRGK